MLSARFKEWSTQGKAEPVPEEGFQVDERFVDTTSPAELGGLQIPMMGSGVVTEGVSGSWSKKSPPVAMGVSPVRAGGLTNAIAAATSNNPNPNPNPNPNNVAYLRRGQQLRVAHAPRQVAQHAPHARFL
jgi:hypothetical protein